MPSNIISNNSKIGLSPNVKGVRHCCFLEQNKKNPSTLRCSDCSLIGGPEEIRTLGLRVANAALYQLSYEPI